MPAPINETVKRQVVQQWLSGEARTKIAIDNNIGEGTISSIIAEFKIGLDNSEFDSARELALSAKKQALNLSELAADFRLQNFIRNSGAALEDIESFIVNVSGSNLPHEKIVELVNQLHDVSKNESLPLDQLSSHIKEKLEEKKKIDEGIKQADAVLEAKNVNIDTINGYLKLNEKLKDYDLSFQDIDKLLNLLANVKENGFDGKKVVGKIRSIQRLEKRKKTLEQNCTALSNLLDKHKETVPLAQLIEAMHVSKSELISFKIAVNEAAETYGFPRSTAALHVISLIKDLNKKGQLQKELSELALQKYAIDRFFSSRSQIIMALMNLHGHGLTDDRILELNNFLESNGYKTSSYTSIK